MVDPKHAFVIMPFDAEFDAVYKDLLAKPLDRELDQALSRSTASAIRNGAYLRRTCRGSFATTRTPTAESSRCSIGAR